LELLADSSVESPTKMALKNKGNLELVEFGDIICLKGEGAYSEFYFQKKGKAWSAIMSYPLSHYETVLPTGQFLRVHKSYIVNKKHVIEIKRGTNYSIKVTHNRILPIAKRKLTDVLNQLKM
jgi:two-component system LytT family response regulator